MCTALQCIKSNIDMILFGQTNKKSIALVVVVAGDEPPRPLYGVPLALVPGQRRFHASRPGQHVASVPQAAQVQHGVIGKLIVHFLCKVILSLFLFSLCVLNLVVHLITVVFIFSLLCAKYQLDSTEQRKSLLRGCENASGKLRQR